MLTCTWAPTVFQAPQLNGQKQPVRAMPEGEPLQQATRGWVEHIESLGITHLLIAQRWFGSGEEIEGSSLDCLAMTAYFAACTKRLHLVTAVHPGFFQPTAIAKWGTTIDRMTQGRWSINVTSGWNLDEFTMYGIDPLTHDARYERSAEFIEVLNGAWQEQPFSYGGKFYQCEGLILDPQPTSPLTIYQGGQSDAAIHMASKHAHWMFLNGGTLEKTQEIINRVRTACADTGRTVRFALYAAPLCAPTDDAAWAMIDQRLQQIEPTLVARRRARVQGAQGMWADDGDPLSMLDTNEGYASRLIGSSASVINRVREFQDAGVEMLHLDLRDKQFVADVLPQIHAL